MINQINIKECPLLLMEAMPALGLVTNLIHIIAKQFFAASLPSYYAKYLEVKTFTTLFLQLIPFYALFNRGSSPQVKSELAEQNDIQTSIQAQPEVLKTSAYQDNLQSFKKANPLLYGDVLIFAFLKENYRAHPEYIDEIPERFKDVMDALFPLSQVEQKVAQRALVQQEVSAPKRRELARIDPEKTQAALELAQVKASREQQSSLVPNLNGFFEEYECNTGSLPFIDPAFEAVNEFVQAATEQTIGVVHQVVETLSDQVGKIGGAANRRVSDAIGEEGIEKVGQVADLAISYAVGTAKDVKQMAQNAPQIAMSAFKQASGALETFGESIEKRTGNLSEQVQDYINNPLDCAEDARRAVVAGAGSVASYALNLIWE